MTQQEAIKKVIDIALAEVGYLEKRSNSNLYDKTANAGSNNYTKYWAEIKPSYQGQPWCACFVTWVLVQAFGIEIATKLLRHYPYVYCPTLGQLHTKNANPKTGDIVIFYRNGTFTHTGIVTGVNGDYFTTVEGNTSGGSTIVANGGAVCEKGYYNSNLPGTKFVTPDWSIVAEATSEPEHFAEEYYNKLMDRGIITDDSWKEYDAFITKALTVAIIDKATGGTWPSDEANSAIHWAQPNVISLCGKKIIEDKDQWIPTLDSYVSKALLLALIDKATGGMKEAYVGRATDHWGRNCLDSLCDKGIITTPEAWCDDFEATVTKGNCMALICKAFNI